MVKLIRNAERYNQSRYCPGYYGALGCLPIAYFYAYIRPYSPIDSSTQLVSDTGSRQGMRCDEAAPSLKIYEQQGCRPTSPDAPSQGRMKWNETKWVRWVWRNSEMEFVAGKTGGTPRKVYSHSSLSTRKPIWNDWDADSRPHLLLPIHFLF